MFSLYHVERKRLFKDLWPWIPTAEDRCTANGTQPPSPTNREKRSGKWTTGKKDVTSTPIVGVRKFADAGQCASFARTPPEGWSCARTRPPEVTSKVNRSELVLPKVVVWRQVKSRAWSGRQVIGLAEAVPNCVKLLKKDRKVLKISRKRIANRWLRCQWQVSANLWKWVLESIEHVFSFTTWKIFFISQETGN